MLDQAKFNNNALNKNVDIIAGSMYRIGGLLHYMYGQIFSNLKKNKVQAMIIFFKIFKKFKIRIIDLNGLNKLS